MHRRRLTTATAALSVAAASVGALVACVGERATPDRRETVTIEASRFSEPELRVAVGTVVVWVNTDPYAHTVTSRDGSTQGRFDSGDLAEGDRFELAFDEPGVVRYFCRIHPTMRASVIVE